MSEQPTSLPIDVIEQIGPVARAVANANQALEGSDSPHYFHFEVRTPYDGCVAKVDGDDPYESVHFGWNPSKGGRK